MLNLILASPFKTVGAVIEWRYANIRIRDGAIYGGTANPASAVINPAAAATAAETTASSNLAIGTYFFKYTWVLNGETLASPEGTFTTTSGQLATLTLPESPTGVTLANVYLSPLNGLSNSETLYLPNVTVSTSATTAVALQAAYVGGISPPDINSTANYAVGVATMAVASVPVTLNTGFQFTIGGDPTIYRIVSHTETAGVTTSITFTPPLALVVNSGAAITFGPNVLLVKVGEGNLTYTEKRPIVYIRNRGVLDTTRLGDDEPVEVKLEFQWYFLTAVSGSGLPTVEDALKRRGEASNWVTSDVNDPCAPYALDLEIEYVPPCSSVQREIISFTTFRYEDLAHDIKQAQISLSGKANIVGPTDVRAA